MAILLIINWCEPGDFFDHGAWVTDSSIKSLDDGETPKFDNERKLRDTRCSGGVFVHFKDIEGELLILLPDLDDNFEDYLLQ